MGVRYIVSRKWETLWVFPMGGGGDPSTYKGRSEERCGTKTQIRETEIDVTEVFRSQTTLCQSMMIRAPHLR